MALAHPEGTALLELEQHSRRDGSGLTATDLVGSWQLWQLWGRRQARPMPAAVALLRPLGACLAISAMDGGHLGMRNSVRLGSLQLCFVGEGELRGRRPLLVFWFERVELRLARRLLWQRPLPRPEDERSRPFFALIASRRQGEEGWLAARGRGGGLALWRLAPPAP
jgi:hypothetical protein